MKDFNKITLKGRIHSYNLEERDTEKGTAIAGDVTLEVNEAGSTVETRFFAYPKYNSGAVNKTYNTLESMMAGNYKTIANDGDEADWLSIDASISVDYYVGRDGAKTIDDLSRSQKVRGSFINTNPKHLYENTWKCDMLITRIEDVEENPEKGLAHKVRMHGFIIDSYNERLLGVRFEAFDDAQMNYLLGLPASPEAPFFSSVKGEFRKVITLKVTEGAFGEDETHEYENTYWVMTWMPRNPYTFGEDITEDEYKAYMDGLDKYKTDKLNKANEENNEDDGLVF